MPILFVIAILITIIWVAVGCPIGTFVPFKSILDESDDKNR